MLFPVRCWTCGKVIGHLWQKFVDGIDQLKVSDSEPVDSFEPVFTEIGVSRFCCYTMFLTHYQKYEQAIKIGFPEDLS